MKASKYKFFILVNFMIVFNSLNNHFLAQTKQNSIIKLFCLQSVKEEMFKAEMVYSEEFANKTCECYIDEFMQIAENVHLDGQVEKIKVPFLVTHGEKDSQIPLKWAQRTYDQLVNSPKRELKIFTQREGGVQHSSFDNSINAGQYIADWVAENLNARTA